MLEFYEIARVAAEKWAELQSRKQAVVGEAASLYMYLDDQSRDA